MHLGNFDHRQFLNQVRRTSKPVIIVCKWLKGLDGMHTEYQGRNEWRLGEQIFDLVREQAVRADRRAYRNPGPGISAMLEGIQCLHELEPPDYILQDLTRQAMQHPDTKVER
jgi:hypothetical protein